MILVQGQGYYTTLLQLSTVKAGRYLPVTVPVSTQTIKSKKRELRGNMKKRSKYILVIGKISFLSLKLLVSRQVFLYQVQVDFSSSKLKLLVDL